jgi:hypothetical protein
MCGAREHAPGEIQSIGSAMGKVRKDGLVEKLLVRSRILSIWAMNYSFTDGMCPRY